MSASDLFRKTSVAVNAMVVVVAIAVFVLGCRVPTPMGEVIEPEVLGTAVDSINRTQEENAELAKYIVYSHEFEINLQEDPSRRAAGEKSNSIFDYVGEPRAHGLRLTPAGEDHVRQIAQWVQQTEPHEITPQVVVERSNTSKLWTTEHHYPVHYNEQLDELRRQVVAKVLESYGVLHADEIVVVAPAYPTGIEATEAAAAFENSIYSYRNNTQRSRQGN
ncbi:hypothetical protein [Rhodopirellula sp. MGV]|uniref:hypothetical protein n=1 Tax=Rhodopirellula sp. MGV TaxID=2023130 RepID=UPI000B979A03|nr:hypothetical protein [Rhodopirellula sp. MGV]OYP37694.1 hypothetical protein CGZ80_04205 [Rhodopirellula sp. MGV]PNY37132.1 hypothetical protein C2E31_09060 [Rhodopirellula baltica]